MPTCRRNAGPGRWLQCGGIKSYDNREGASPFPTPNVTPKGDVNVETSADNGIQDGISQER